MHLGLKFHVNGISSGQVSLSDGPFGKKTAKTDAAREFLPQTHVITNIHSSLLSEARPVGGFSADVGRLRGGSGADSVGLKLHGQPRYVFDAT